MSPVAITGIGAVTPVGLSAVASAAALRAGVSRLGPFWSSLRDTHRGHTKPAMGGRVPLEWLSGGPAFEEWPGHERFGVEPPPPAHLVIEDGAKRLVELAGPALGEAWERAGGATAPPRDWGLFVGIPEGEDPKSQATLETALVDLLLGFQPARVELVPEGRASALTALDRARRAVAEGRLAGAFAGGVDSLIRPSSYAKLLAADRIRDPEFNPQGIAPAEAAAFLVLEPGAQRAKPLAWLEGVGLAREPTAGSEEPNLAVGLTRAIRGARAGVRLSTLPLVICDLNGYRARALEWALASTRALGDLRWAGEGSSSGQTWHPADCFGDCGAASGAVDCAWAIEALQVGYARGEQVLVWGASDGAQRAAAILRRAS
jgi:3-oxoacyl-[acyl-carrier-protein] synthase I